MIRRTKLLVRRYILPLKTDHPGVILVTGVLDGPLDHSVNDIPLVLPIKDTERSTVWSDGPRNKYDPGLHVCIRTTYEPLSPS